MCKSCLSVLLAALLLAFSACACADGLTPLDMNSTAIAPAPKDECYLSDNEYKDDSIHVELSEGKYAGVHYTMAHVTISDPSQLRTIPAAQVNNPKAEFSVFSDKAAPAVRMAQSANAVIAINGDYITIPRICQIAMRQGQQIRNNGNGSFDLLVIDRNGDFGILPACTKEDYVEYYNRHADSMYQVFCFGPAIVLDGRSTIPKDYENGYISGQRSPRSARWNTPSSPRTGTQCSIKPVWIFIRFPCCVKGSDTASVPKASKSSTTWTAATVPPWFSNAGTKTET